MPTIESLTKRISELGLDSPRRLSHDQVQQLSTVAQVVALTEGKASFIDLSQRAHELVRKTVQKHKRGH